MRRLEGGFVNTSLSPILTPAPAGCRLPTRKQPPEKGSRFSATPSPQSGRACSGLGLARPRHWVDSAARRGTPVRCIARGCRRQKGSMDPPHSVCAPKLELSCSVEAGQQSCEEAARPKPASCCRTVTDPSSAHSASICGWLSAPNPQCPEMPTTLEVVAIQTPPHATSSTDTQDQGQRAYGSKHTRKSNKLMPPRGDRGGQAAHGALLPPLPRAWP